MSSKIKLIKKNIFTASFALLGAASLTGCVKKYDGNSNSVVDNKTIVYENTDNSYNDIDNLYIIRTKDGIAKNCFIVKKVKCDDIDNNTIDQVTFGSKYIESRWKKLFLNNHIIDEVNSNTYLYIDVINDELVTITYNETEDYNNIEEYYGEEIIDEKNLQEFLDSKSCTISELEQLLKQIKIDSKKKVYTK